MNGYSEDGSHGNQNRGWLRAEITPGPLLALAIIGIFLLMLAIFVFGQRGKYPDVDVADLFRTLAIGTIAAAVTTIVDRKIAFKDLHGRIEASLRQAVGIAPSLDALGVHAAHPHPFDFGLIFREAEPNETINWLDTYCPRQNEFRDTIVDCVQKGVNVRMLIIEANCANARFRSKELGGGSEGGKEFEGGLTEFKTRMQKISGSARGGSGKFEIRMYSDLLGVPMYIIQNRDGKPRKAYFSLYLSRATGYCAHIELRPGEFLSDMLSYFDAKWTRQENKLASSQYER